MTAGANPTDTTRPREDDQVAVVRNGLVRRRLKKLSDDVEDAYETLREAVITKKDAATLREREVIAKRSAASSPPMRENGDRQDDSAEEVPGFEIPSPAATVPAAGKDWKSRFDAYRARPADPPKKEGEEEEEGEGEEEGGDEPLILDDEDESVAGEGLVEREKRSGAEEEADAAPEEEGETEERPAPRRRNTATTTTTTARESERREREARIEALRAIRAKKNRDRRGGIPPELRAFYQDGEDVERDSCKGKRSRDAYEEEEGEEEEEDEYDESEEDDSFIDDGVSSEDDDDTRDDLLEEEDEDSCDEEEEDADDEPVDPGAAEDEEDEEEEEDEPADEATRRRKEAARRRRAEEKRKREVVDLADLAEEEYGEEDAADLAEEEEEDEGGRRRARRRRGVPRDTPPRPSVDPTGVRPSEIADLLAHHIKKTDEKRFNPLYEAYFDVVGYSSLRSVGSPGVDLEKLLRRAGDPVSRRRLEIVAAFDRALAGLFDRVEDELGGEGERARLFRALRQSVAVSLRERARGPQAKKQRTGEAEDAEEATVEHSLTGEKIPRDEAIVARFEIDPEARKQAEMRFETTVFNLSRDERALVESLARVKHARRAAVAEMEVWIRERPRFRDREECTLGELRDELGRFDALAKHPMNVSRRRLYEAVRYLVNDVLKLE